MPALTLRSIPLYAHIEIVEHYERKTPTLGDDLHVHSADLRREPEPAVSYGALSETAPIGQRWPQESTHYIVGLT